MRNILINLERLNVLFDNLSVSNRIFYTISYFIIIFCLSILLKSFIFFVFFINIISLFKLFISIFSFLIPQGLKNHNGEKYIDYKSIKKTHRKKILEITLLKHEKVKNFPTQINKLKNEGYDEFIDKVLNFKNVYVTNSFFLEPIKIINNKPYKPKPFIIYKNYLRALELFNLNYFLSKISLFTFDNFKEIENFINQLTYNNNNRKLLIEKKNNDNKKCFDLIIFDFKIKPENGFERIGMSCFLIEN